MSVFLTLLKGIAILTPTAKDDKIQELLSTLFSQLRGGRKAGK